MNNENLMEKRRNPINPIDDEARELMQSLLLENRYGAIGVKEPETVVPLVSRIAVCFTRETGLFFCASDLSSHSKCLLKDPVCSLLLGEPGKGDGLAYPRVTVIGTAARLPNDHEKRAELRESFLKVHPKAALYVDFADFGFYPMVIERAQLNGGFGKAFNFETPDLEFLIET